MLTDKYDVLYNIQEIVTAVCSEDSALSVEDIKEIRSNMEFSLKQINNALNKYKIKDELNKVIPSVQK